MYFDLDKTLTYNCLFNLIIGNRGCGKTYGAKKRAIKNFLKKGEQFIYLRRYDSELELIQENLFNDIQYNEEFKGHKIDYKAGYFYVDEVMAGYSMALTKSHYYKSSSFPRVKLIIFDEFVIDTGGTTSYLKNEVEKFLDFYETIARKRDVIVLFLANAITFINPYTVYWNLRLPYNSNFVRKDDLILLQLVQDEGFINEKRQTRFGRLIDGTTYGDYAINNKFLRDSDTFIEKKTGSAQYYFTFKYNGTLYGVWIDYQKGKMYVSENIDPTCGLTYTLTLEDHSPNTLLIKRLNSATLFKRFLEAYKDGYVFFESLKIKNIVYDVFKMTIT
ncbi:MAG: phage DNA encapsidation protein [Bacillota bacterium]|nr:phage DNA encapsidation protein [Bacillota bacterium]